MRAIVPLKAPPGAKSRLGPALAPAARLALYRSMAGHVLAALQSCPAIAGITVVTSGAEGVMLAERHGAAPLRLEREAGMNTDLAAALDTCPAGPVAIVAGDLPLVTPGDFAEIARAAQPGHVVLAPDRHGDGTNVLAFGAGARIAPSFGPGSFQRHQDAALAAGFAVTIVRTPSLSFDIDTPADLAELARRHPSTGFSAEPLALVS
jgi:2-phospho-L-lactate guanylyltransferase